MKRILLIIVLGIIFAPVSLAGESGRPSNAQGVRCNAGVNKSKQLLSEERTKSEKEIKDRSASIAR